MSHPIPLELTKPSPMTVFQPSEYTALILSYLRDRPEIVRGRDICEIGTGNGVIAAQAALLGASSLTITDIEELGLEAARECLSSIPTPPKRIEYLKGPVWDPVGSRTFDVILTNLPHFPCETLHLPGRLPSWAVGGVDGRDILDPFIDGIARHLREDGVAIFTHNRFVDIELTRRHVADAGLHLATSHDMIVPLHPLKVAALSLGTLDHSADLFQIGSHCFGRVCLAIVGRAGSGAAV